MATGQELIDAALAAVDQTVQDQIAAARKRHEHHQRQRQELAAARARGIPRRHAQRLRNLQRDRSVGLRGQARAGGTEDNAPKGAAA